MSGSEAVSEIIARVDTVGLLDITDGLHNDGEARWSPDGKKIVFSSDREGNLHIFTMDPDGSGAKRLTTEGSFNANPAWSPDGKQIVFVSNRNGENQIYVMDMNGKNVKEATQKDC